MLENYILFYPGRSVKPVLTLQKRGVQDGDTNYLFFGYDGIPSASVNTSFRWYEAASEFEPGFSVDWVRSMTGANAPSTVIARFSWCHPGDIVDMSLADACLTFEHYVDWK